MYPDLHWPGFRSLHLRLLLAMVVVVIVAVGVTGLVASRRTLAEFQSYVGIANTARYHRFTEALARDYNASHDWTNVVADVERDSLLSGQRVLVADEQGIIVADSGQSLKGTLASPDWLHSQAPIVANNVRVGTLYLDPIAGPSPADVAFVSAINRSALLGAGVACLAAVAITLLLAGSIVRPVERLTAAARRMKTGDLAVQVPVGSVDEIGELARAFNAMASGLAQQEKLRRSMVEDIAHELRTPLTNLRGYLEAARDGLLSPDAALVDNLYEETMLLQRLVADLQDLALAEAGQLALVREPTALSALAEQAVGILRPQAEAKGVALQVAMPSELPLVNMDRGRIAQVFRNLLYNAYSHTPADASRSRLRQKARWSRFRFATRVQAFNVMTCPMSLTASIEAISHTLVIRVVLALGWQLSGNWSSPIVAPSPFPANLAKAASFRLQFQSREKEPSVDSAPK